MWQKAKNYVVETWEDFKSCWNVYPNVIIWSAVLFLVALFV